MQIDQPTITRESLRAGDKLVIARTLSPDLQDLMEGQRIRMVVRGGFSREYFVERADDTDLHLAALPEALSKEFSRLERQLADLGAVAHPERLWQGKCGHHWRHAGGEPACPRCAEIDDLKQQLADKEKAVGDLNGLVHMLRVAGCALIVELRQLGGRQIVDRDDLPVTAGVNEMRALCALKPDAIRGYAAALHQHYRVNSARHDFLPGQTVFYLGVEEAKPQLTVEQRVTKILVEEIKVDAAHIIPETRLADDLNLDSLDLVEFTQAAEKVFGIDLGDADIGRLVTVGDLVKLCSQAIKVPA